MSMPERDRAHRAGRCPACGATALELFACAGALRLVRCLGCSLVFSDPQPRASVRAKYLEHYDLAAHFGPLTARKRVIFKRHMNDAPPARVGQRLCDVGCADGQFLAVARELGWTGSGVELNPQAAERARRAGFDVYEGEFEDLEGLPWGTCDLVTCWNCLEHTPDPHMFAERLVRLARPGATILLSTLNLPSLASAAFGTRWSMILEDHFTYWSRVSLERLFTSLGCNVTRCTTFGLGRDFVTWIDALQRLRRRGRAHSRGPAALGRASSSRSGWDVWPGVLAAERALNRLLAVNDRGVVITCAMQRAYQ